MNLKQLEYFIQLSQTLNYTKAAENLFISQSAITKQIQNLEKELGVLLFERDHKKVQLTLIGKQYVKEAQEILDKVNLSYQHIEAYQRGIQGKLKIGFLKDFDIDLLIPLIRLFHKQYPDVELELGGYHHSSLNQQLKNGDIDIAINIDSQEARELIKIEFHDYPLVGIVHHESPIAHQKNISINQFYSLIYDIRDEQKELENIELEGALLQVACGLGEAIVHEFVISNTLHQYIKVLPLNPYQSKKVYLMYHPMYDHPLIQNFITIFTNKKIT